MTANRDIVIAGGGMVGVSLALQLGAVLPEETSILLVESFPFPTAVTVGKPDYHPSFDARSTALSYSSRIIYEKMQVWEGLQQWLCAIDSIHVSSRGHFGSTLLNADDHSWQALGYVVENAWLGNALIQALYRQGRVEVCSPAKVVAATPAGAGIRLQLEGAAEPCMEAALLVVADGASSGLRAQLGVAVAEKSYRQHALIANISTAEAHRGCAYERFTDNGPVALLPLLAAPGGEHRSALVWTLPPEQAEHLQDCPELEFLHTLQECFGYRLGRLLHVGERHSYPLALVQSSEQVRQGLVVMGNAAHALHPVAGQGYNLALRDVAELGAMLAQGIAAGLPPGDLATLQRYQQRQQADQGRTIDFSDRVPALFMHADPVLGLGRDLALAGLDIMPGLKREFVRYATGVAAMSEQVDG
ncbi:MAG: 2-octaprenyl-6-methoxyphenyl hydroxylase [Halioglobus sp.]